MIKTIAYQNLKGASAKHDLEKLTLITGGNFAGKSTVLQAIILATNGFLPALGKTNPATFQLASAGTMTVQISMTTRPTGEAIFARQWKQSGKTIKQTSSGGALPPLSILSAEAFTAATPKARLAMLAGQAGGDWTALEKLVFDIAKRHNIKREGETSMEEAETVQEALKEKATESRARIDQFEKTLAGLVELAASDPTFPPIDYTEEIKTAQTALNEALAEVGRIEAACDEAFDAKKLLEEFSDAAEEPADPGTMGTQIAGQRAAIRLLEQDERKTAARLNEIEPLLYPVWTEEDDAHRDNALEIKATSGATLEQVAKDLEDLRQNASAHHARAVMLREQIQTIKNQMAAFKHNEACPTCGACEAGWQEKAHETFSLQLHDKQERLETEIEDGRRVELLHATQTVVRNALQRLPALEAQHAAHAAAPALRTEAEELRTLRSAQIAAMNGRQEAIDNLECLQRDWNRANQRHTEWKRLNDIASKEAEHGALLDKALDRQIIAQKEHDTLIEKDAQMAGLRSAWAAAKHREQDLVNARHMADTEAEILEAIKADDKALQTTKDETLRTLYAPVVATAQSFSEGVLPSPLDLHPTTGQIGRWNGEAFIPYDAMSGAEQLVAVASLQAALASAGRGILLLDEMSRMRDDTKRAFLTKVEEAVNAGRIEQAIVIDVGHAGYDAWHEIAP